MRTLLRNEQWKRIEHLLPGKPGDPGRHGEDNRRFVEAVLWISRTGAPWRDLPEHFGGWNTVYQRFRRWSRSGVWQTLFMELSKDSEFAARFDDCPGAPACRRRSQKNGPQGLGRSRGGLTSKIHALVEGMGQLMRFAITGGEVADITQAQGLLADASPDIVVADKGYDSDELVSFIREKQAKAVIPPRRNRLHRRRYDRAAYRDRNRIEGSSAVSSNFDVSPPATTSCSNATPLSSRSVPRSCGSMPNMIVNRPLCQGPDRSAGAMMSSKSSLCRQSADHTYREVIEHLQQLDL